MFASHFSVRNIPFGIASSKAHPQQSAATRIEDTVIFLDELAKHNLLSSLPASAIDAFSQVNWSQNIFCVEKIANLHGTASAQQLCSTPQIRPSTNSGGTSGSLHQGIDIIAGYIYCFHWGCSHASAHGEPGFHWFFLLQRSCHECRRSCHEGPICTSRIPPLPHRIHGTNLFDCRIWDVSYEAQRPIPRYWWEGGVWPNQGDGLWARSWLHRWQAERAIEANRYRRRWWPYIWISTFEWLEL